ncbi:serine/threonine-protein kinase D3-like isoform X2 [Narcine bancroftii]|uniref:serine/threonine-protein kinase D3-like isoform X2 n=1 Tax=Narcine bancroftii TaxID=1343680 RepID=UPI0038315082
MSSEPDLRSPPPVPAGGRSSHPGLSRSPAPGPPGDTDRSPRPHQGSTAIPHTGLQFHIQVGLRRESVSMRPQEASFGEARELALHLILNQFPDASTFQLRPAHLLLFRHDQNSKNILLRLSSCDLIHEGDLIEVVLSGSALKSVREIFPHILQVHSYKVPTFCNHCGEMLWGLVRQGLKCAGCGLDFHKRCAYKIPNNCSRNSCFPPHKAGQKDETCWTPLSLQAPWAVGASSRRHPQLGGRPPWMDQLELGHVRVPHTFHVHSYSRPTVCQQCWLLLRGLFRQGMQCRDCRFNCHKRCMEHVPNDCLGEAPMLNGEEGQNSEAGHPLGKGKVEIRLSDTRLLDKVEDDPNPDRGSLSDWRQDPHDEPLSVTNSGNIPLMRVVQSVRQTNRSGSTVLKEGWLFHHSQTDTLRRRHYWRLDSKNITLFQNDTDSKFFKRFPLSNILLVRSCPESQHCFELVTGCNTFYVGESKLPPAQTLRPPGQEPIPGESQAWEQAIRQALRPVTSQPSLGTSQREAGKHRTSGRDVAIKVIDKLRFPSEQESQLHNEAIILQELQHPGVVNLDAVFKDPDRVFVVMEKLRGDMLEMILSSERSRLPERLARFLTTQILKALHYLHSKNIVHCDLKPENVLLASDDPYPQVKLCDFGFARIIGEKSFRRSVVGTAAYLAPEVLQNKAYNRALDMWAVGVIVYVCLSGTFPFNEDEDITDQIHNASFMYPIHPWHEVSSAAIGLINSLLQVKIRKRCSVDRALCHPWLQDFQTWLDLRALEMRLGRRYLTHECDDVLWQLHAAKHGLEYPAHLVTAHSPAEGIEEAP